MNVREATENGEVRLVSVKTQHQCADIFTKSLTKEKFKRFRDTIRGAVTYKDMVTEEINSSEQCAKAVTERWNGFSTFMQNDTHSPWIA